MFTESREGEVEIIDIERNVSPIVDLLQSLRYNDEGEFTITAAQQKATEANVSSYLNDSKTIPEEREKIELKRSAHKNYLIRGLRRLSAGYQGLDASQPWLCYWILNSLDVLGYIPDAKQEVEGNDFLSHETLSDACNFLSSCVDKKYGGFAGGPYQLAHLAPTYAAVNAICVIGTQEAYDSIDRKSLYEFLISMKDESGGFRMHHDGELDIRATYCALSVASLLNLLDDKLLENVGSFLRSCQTFEGGISAEPGNEAHGGYSFCGLATGILSSTYDVLDLDRLLYWASSRQCGYEGGFNGRTNKLVDSCYSFWQGAIFPLLNQIRSYSLPEKHFEFTPNAGTSPFEETLYDSSLICNQRGLQDYILLCCQPLGGGLRDKPPKSQDYYHTCYALNGLSVMQHNHQDMPPTVVGKEENLLQRVDPLHGIRTSKSEKAKEYFSKKEKPQ